MKPDERALLVALLNLHGWKANNYPAGENFADKIGNGLGVYYKRTQYLLEKWARRGWWDCGVSARSGWFTPEGIAALRLLGLEEAGWKA